MEDLYFEEELKKREKRKLFDKVKSQINISSLFGKDGIFSSEINEYLCDFDVALEYYFYEKNGIDIEEIDDNDEKERIWDEVDAFIEKFINELQNGKLVEIYEKYGFSEEEQNFINMIGISRNLHNTQFKNMSVDEAVFQVLLKKFIDESFSREDKEYKEHLRIALKKLKEHDPFSYDETFELYYRLLSDKPYGENVKEMLEQEVESQTESNFNYAFNCAGYALKIDNIVDTPYQDASKTVSTIIEKFPFVRLLGNTPLENDEYLVMYRVKPNGKAHHFIRVDSDGTIREKDGISEPRIFTGWYDSYSDCQDIIFAVKKEHKMFDWSYGEVQIQHKGLNFEEVVNQSIISMNNNFSYHNQEFSLKKTSEGKICVVDKIGNIVANVFSENGEYVVEVNEDKKGFVENFSGDIVPRIKNGKLENLDEFRIGRRPSQSNYDKNFSEDGAIGL